MKTLIMSLALLMSAQVFANGVQECSALMGKYKCAYNNEIVEVEIQGKVSDQALKIQVEGRTDYYYIDGEPQRTDDDTVVSVVCKNNKEIYAEKWLSITERQPLFSIVKTEKYLQMINGLNEVVLNCKK